jgi:quercetin dioxygenase-like cupin family protein
VGRVVIQRTEELVLSRASDRMSAEQLARYGDGEVRSLKRTYFPVDGEPLQLFEIRLDPDAEVQPHAHSASEIIFVTEGEIRLGAQVCGAGTAIFIDAETLYGFRAGPDGAAFLNFRGDPAPEYIFKDDLVARMKAAKVGNDG